VLLLCKKYYYNKSIKWLYFSRLILRGPVDHDPDVLPRPRPRSRPGTGMAGSRLLEANAMASRTPRLVQLHLRVPRKWFVNNGRWTVACTCCARSHLYCICTCTVDTLCLTWCRISLVSEKFMGRFCCNGDKYYF